MRSLTQLSGQRTAPKGEAGRRSRSFVQYKSHAVEIRCSQSQREAWVLAAKREGYLSLSDWIRDRLDGAARARVMHSSDHQAFNTPANVLQAIAPMGTIGLDPCSNASSIVEARIRWTIEHDGLACSWAGQLLRGDFVFVNPPFDEIATWVDRCIAEAACGAHVCLLSPARVDVGWWDRLLAAGGIAGLWRGRWRFLGMGSAPFPGALTWLGPRSDLRTRWRRALAPHVISFATHVSHDPELQAAAE
mgnify:CR=1 FL=1